MEGSHEMQNRYVFFNFLAPFLKMFLFEVAKFYLTKYQVLNELNFFSGSLYL